MENVSFRTAWGIKADFSKSINLVDHESVGISI
jgi:hypothetical protein